MLLQIKRHHSIQICHNGHFAIGIDAVLRISSNQFGMHIFVVFDEIYEFPSQTLAEAFERCQYGFIRVGSIIDYDVRRISPKDLSEVLTIVHEPIE